MIETVVEAFRTGGWPMYPVLFAGLLALWLAAIHARRPHPSAFSRAIVAFAVLLALGAGGTFYLRRLVASVLPNVPPEHRVAVMEMGEREARRPVQLAGVIAVPTADQPRPGTGNVAPVTPHAGDRANSSASTTSSSVAHADTSAPGIAASFAGVRIVPGATAFARMPCVLPSSASTCMSAATAAFEAT